MTFRAILIGLLGAVAIATLGFINDEIVQLDSLISGQQLPIVVIGAMIVMLVAFNPLLFRFRRGWSFKPAEVAVVTMLMMVSCSIPSRGLLEQFLPALGLPARQNNDIAKGWKKNNLLSYVPPAMLPADGKYDSQVSDGMASGTGNPDNPIGLDQIPWGKWLTPMTLWLPLLMLMMISVICLVLVVHRQWSANERLRYPIAEFATTLMTREGDRPIGPIFRNKLFWIGLGVVFLIHLNNGINIWTDERWIKIPLNFDFTRQFGEKFPLLGKVPWGSKLLAPTIYPVVIGFSFFLASEVSLSLGLTQLIYVPLAATMMTYGMNIQSDIVGGGLGGWQRFGSFLAMGLIIIYTGRRYYRQVLTGALTFRKQEGVANYAVWACRIFLICQAVMIGIAINLGLDWPLAIIFFALAMLTFFCIARINAETGLFFIQPRWHPLGVMIGFFGGYALGPEAMVIIGLLGVVLVLEVSQAMIPYFTNSMKFCESQGIAPPRPALPAGATWTIAMIAGLVVAFWASYNYGLGTRRGKLLEWSYKRVPGLSFVVPNKEVTKIRNSGEDRLAKSIALKPLERLASFRPNDRFLIAAGAGLVLVLIFGALRLRFSWWPIHPVLFLVWDTYPLGYFCASFVLGYLIKSAVTRLGGRHTYQNLKPLMIGLIAGDVMGGLFWLVMGWGYYALFGLQPKLYEFFPK